MFSLFLVGFRKSEKVNAISATTSIDRFQIAKCKIWIFHAMHGVGNCKHMFRSRQQHACWQQSNKNTLTGATSQCVYVVYDWQWALKSRISNRCDANDIWTRSISLMHGCCCCFISELSWNIRINNLSQSIMKYMVGFVRGVHVCYF